MSVRLDRDAVEQAYLNIRNDQTPTNWVIFKTTDDGTLTVSSDGVEFEEFKEQFRDDERAFGFIRIMTGDEMSKRPKFSLITWCGNNVKPLQRARTSADKAVLQEIVKSYAVDLMFSEPGELNEEEIKTQLVKAGGANYGTGV